MSTALEAKELLRTGYWGALATQSKEMPGYPFGSVVPYCLDRNGYPVILISNIAQHYHNIQVSSKISLLVLAHDERDVQKAGRLTWIADAQKIDVEDTDTIGRYYQFFPKSRDYHQTHGFYFYRLHPVRVRYIGGFGKIHWLDAPSCLEINPFSAQEERDILEHMNNDHAKSLLTYCHKAGIALEGLPVLVGVEARGFYLLCSDNRIFYLKFDQPVHNMHDIRQAFIALSR
jgi:putative heme iron utilization protein